LIDLDDLGLLEKIDSLGFLSMVEGLPSQLVEASELGEQVTDLPTAEGINSIAILGMGGSGISGDVFEAVVSPHSNLFVKTIKGYGIPGWVGPSTLVFAVSHSGNTEETVEGFECALQSGAKIVVLSAGGALGERSRSLGLPSVALPSGIQPRSAIGYLTIPMLVICRRMGILKGDFGLAETIDIISRRSIELRADVPAQQNLAKQFAIGLSEKIPVIYGSEGLGQVAAYRWKCQFNECSKSPAYYNCFSELNHNEIEGWGQLESLTRSSLGLIVLRHGEEHPRIPPRVEATIDIIGDHLGFVKEFFARGGTTLSRLFDLIYMGDFVATYLGLAQGLDPGPVGAIEGLKKQIGVRSR